MAKHTLKILWCEHCNNIMHERVKVIQPGLNEVRYTLSLFYEGA